LNGAIFNFSPSLKGSSSFITSYIYEQLLSNKIRVEVINVCKFKILPCNDCSNYCFRYGRCKIKDDEMYKIYEILIKKEFFIFVTPVYFYHLPGYAKIMIDRCQPYWVRKYVLKIFDIDKKLGFLVCIGATKGKRLFSGINLTIKYFFDIFNIQFDKKNNLYLRNIETKEDIDKKIIDGYIYNLFKLIKV